MPSGTTVSDNKQLYLLHGHYIKLIGIIVRFHIVNYIYITFVTNCNTSEKESQIKNLFQTAVDDNFVHLGF